MKRSKPPTEFWTALAMVNVLGLIYRSTSCFAPTASIRTFSRPVYSSALFFCLLWLML